MSEGFLLIVTLIYFLPVTYMKVRENEMQFLFVLSDLIQLNFSFKK